MKKNYKVWIKSLDEIIPNQCAECIGFIEEPQYKSVCLVECVIIAENYIVDTN